MLQKLNSRIQGWFAWVVIIVIALTFALFGVEHYIESRQANLAKAQVNGKAISLRDFELQYRRTQRRDEPSNLSAAAEDARRKALVDDMIMKSIAIDSAVSSGFNVTAAQTTAAIQTIPQFQEEGQFSMGRFQQALRNALFTPESFQAEVNEGILLNQQHFAFADTAFALPVELEQFVKLYKQTRDFDYLVIPYQSFIHDIKIEDKAIDAYYQKHHDQFKTPEKVAIEYIRLSMSNLRETIKISDDKVRQFYEENKSNYTTPAEWHVAHIFFALPQKSTPEQQTQVEKKANQASELLKKSPQQFEQLVKTQSDDKISVADSGVLPWITAGQSEFDKGLVDLTTVGEISAPVKTSQGYEIFKLLAYKPASIKPFETVKSAIKNQMILDLAQADYARALEQLSDLSYQTPDTLQPVADALKLNIEHTEPFSREGGQTAVTKNPLVLQAAYSPEVLAQGNNSEPVQLDNDTVIVLRLLKHIPASEQTLAEVKPSIVSLLRKEQAEEKAKKLGQTLFNEISKNMTKETELLHANNLSWKHGLNISRESSDVPVAINQIAFQMGRPRSMIVKPLENGDFALIRLTQIHEGKMSELTKDQIANLSQQIAAAHGAKDYDLYMKALLDKAVIVRY